MGRERGTARGATRLKLPSKWSPWQRLALHFSETKAQSTSCFPSILAQPAPFPASCPTDCSFCPSVSLALCPDKLFSHSGIDSVVSVAALGGGESKFAG